MLKGVIERDAPAFSGAGLATSTCKTIAVIACRPCCRPCRRCCIQRSATISTSGGSGNGNNSKPLGWGDDHGDAFPGNYHDDTAALVLLAAAIVLGIATCPISKEDLRAELVAPTPITTTSHSATVNKDGIFSAGMAPPLAPSAAELMAYAGLALIAAKRHSLRILCLYVVGIRM